MKSFRVIAALVVCLSIAGHAGARCGPSRLTNRDISRPETIQLTARDRGLLDAPMFYWRTLTNPNRNTVLLFKPEDVVDALSARIKDAKPGQTDALLKMIQQDLPLAA